MSEIEHNLSQIPYRIFDSMMDFARDEACIVHLRKYDLKSGWKMVGHHANAGSNTVAGKAFMTCRVCLRYQNTIKIGLQVNFSATSFTSESSWWQEQIPPPLLNGPFELISCLPGCSIKSY